jgi:hypothetical protein
MGFNEAAALRATLPKLTMVYGGLRHAQSHGPCSECRPPRFHPACMFDLQSLNLTYSPFATLHLSAHLSGTSLIALCLSRSPGPLRVQRMN